jgi:hypothetical protein
MTQISGYPGNMLRLAVGAIVFEYRKSSTENNLVKHFELAVHRNAGHAQSPDFLDIMYDAAGLDQV